MNDNNAPALGENLMAAVRLCQARIDAELNAEGFAFMAGAQGQILHLIDPGGTPENITAKRSKFNVDIAPLIDALIRSGAVVRENDKSATLRITDLGQRGVRASQVAVQGAECQFEESLHSGHSKSFHDLIHLLLDQPGN